MQIFKPISLIKNLPLTIECLSAHSNCLVIATKQGHLMKYKFASKRNVQLSSHELEIEIELVKSYKQFSKKPVTQVETVPELKIIITLSDGLIHVNDLDDLSIYQIIQKTKGATCFSTNLQTQMTLTGEVQYMLRMCVVVKRKIILLYWKNKNFHEMSKEINLNDQPRTIVWCSESLFIGYKSEYDLIKLASGQEEEIKNLSATGGKTEPMIRLLHDNKASINRDQNTYILDQNGDPYLKYPIGWSDIPENIAEDYPYLVALLPSSIVEVRTIEPHIFIQRLEFAQLISNYSSQIRILTKCAGRKGMIIAASANDIFAIVAIPVDQQKSQMVMEKHFELALRLANMEQKSEDASTRDIELQYAHDLFHKGSYKEALDLFLKLDISPLIVIELFPDLSDKVFTQPDPPSSKTSSQSAKSESTDLRITALIDYFIQIRRRISKMSKSVTSLPSGGRPSIDNGVQGEDYTLFSHMKSSRALELLKQEVDTTLLKCYLKTTDALVASLLRLPDNHCKIQVTEKALIKYHKYNELIILYQSRGLHTKALELLKTHFQDSPISGYEKTVQYLQHLGQDHIEIILQYSRWVLENEPELGLKIFTADLPETEQLDRSVVLEFLRNNFPQLEIPYLEHLIHLWNDKTSFFHTTLLLRYRQKVAPLLAKYTGDKPAGQEEGELGELRRKLLDFLEISDHYTTQGLPALLLNEGLGEERAIVLGKLGDHEEALCIFIYLLKSPKRAEEYCLSVYKKGLPASEGIFLTLLKLYLHPPETLSSNQLKRKASVSSQMSNESVVDLLRKHGDKIDPLEGISVLPDRFDLIKLKDYLDRTFKRKLQDSHSEEVYRNLLMTKYYNMKKTWIELQQANKITIDETTSCQVCNKKIGRSAFARYPNKDVVHYSCKDKRL